MVPLCITHLVFKGVGRASLGEIEACKRSCSTVQSNVGWVFCLGMWESLVLDIVG
jgi:hypothetical protein